MNDWSFHATLHRVAWPLETGFRPWCLTPIGVSHAGGNWKRQPHLVGLSFLRFRLIRGGSFASPVFS